MEIEEKYMWRALRLARLGCGFVSPNPMVGAVIVHDGLIIGEGYHRRYGEGHAEVNAVASVKDKSLLRDSTMYVTLEPCAHYGKTPPCAKLIVDMGIPRVVVGCRDPFAKVSGRGITMLRDAGIEVEVGLLEHECLKLNEMFIKAHARHKPYVILKWAMSEDGYTDRHRNCSSESPERFSSAITAQQVHLLRSRVDAIIAGAGTVCADDPRLDVRDIYGRSPRPVVLDRRGTTSPSAAVYQSERRTLLFTGFKRYDVPEAVEQIVCTVDAGIDFVLEELYRRGIISVLVEGGPTVLRSFLDCGMWDMVRVERAPWRLGESGRGQMEIPSGETAILNMDNRVIVTVKNPQFRG